MECRGLNEVECLKHKKYCRYTTGKRRYCRKLKNKTKKISPKMSSSKSPSSKSIISKTPTITETDEYIIVKNGDLSKKPHAVFDLDYTLIKTKSGRKFPKDGDDWVYLYDNTREMLLEMSGAYNIILFTNQKRVRKAEELVPKIAYYTMRKRFVKPSEKECDTLITVTNKVAEYSYMFPRL